MGFLPNSNVFLFFFFFSKRLMFLEIEKKIDFGPLHKIPQIYGREEFHVVTRDERCANFFPQQHGYLIFDHQPQAWAGCAWFAFIFIFIFLFNCRLGKRIQCCYCIVPCILWWYLSHVVGLLCWSLSTLPQFVLS